MTRYHLAVPTAALMLMLASSSTADAQGPRAPAPLGTVGATTMRYAKASLATGIRMHYAERGITAGEPVIMLHGTSDSWFSFSRIMPLLPTKYRVFALDLRGHGESDQPEGGYAMRDLAADVVAFMDARGINRATIVGHSMGSVIAQQLAVVAPDRVSALVLIGAGTGFRHMPEFREEVLALTDPVSVEFIRAFQVSTVHHRVPDAFMNEAIRISQRLPARVWHAVIRGMFDAPVATGLDSLVVPVLLVRGDLDSVFPPGEFDALTTLFDRPTVIRYSETGHAPHWERPHRVARDLEAFLDRLPRATKGARGR
jgi:pimeloyl-ACP methyl ester carboxylesterase